MGFMDQIDLPDAPIPGQPLIEIFGHKRVLIENHKGVIRYSGTEIAVKVMYGHIVIAGNSLELSRMTKDTVIVSGMIGGVTLNREG